MTLFPESKYTRPHAAAWHPEWWHAPDGDSTEDEVSELVGAMVRGMQPEVVVETGTAFGFTTRYIGDALRRNGHGVLYSVDIDEERLAHARALLAGGEGRPSLLAPDGPVHVLQQSSLEFVPPAPIDFAFFDSLYELRVDEFLFYRDQGALRPGAIVAFHDWTSKIRGQDYDVQGELEERLVRPGLVRLVYLPSPRGLAVGEVL